jgi:RNA polymerase sporulation-specific sigma factor
MVELPDAVLIEQFKDGNEAAFECLLARYDLLIKKIARKYFGHSYEPEDFYQVGAMAFLDAVLKYEERKEYTFYAFALSCVRNGLISEYRKIVSQIEYTASNEILSFVKETRRNYSALNSEFAEEASGSILFTYGQLIKEVLESEHLLSRFEKRCFKRYVEGKSYGEIALELNEEIKTIDNALVRCRKKMRKAMKHAKTS